LRSRPGRAVTTRTLAAMFAVELPFVVLTGLGFLWLFRLTTAWSEDLVWLLVAAGYLSKSAALTEVVAWLAREALRHPGAPRHGRAPHVSHRRLLRRGLRRPGLESGALGEGLLDESARGGPLAAASGSTSMTRISGTTPLGRLRSTRTTARPRRNLSIDLTLELRGERAPVKLDATLCANPFARDAERWLGDHAQVVTVSTTDREAMARASVSVDEVRPDGTLVGTLHVDEDGWDLSGPFEAARAARPSAPARQPA